MTKIVSVTKITEVLNRRIAEAKVAEEKALMENNTTKELMYWHEAKTLESTLFYINLYSVDIE